MTAPARAQSSTRTSSAQRRDAHRARPRRVPVRALGALLNAQWAMEREYLDRMLAVLQREQLDLGAIASAAGEPVEGTRRVSIRDGIATIPVRGPMMHRATFFSDVCGVTSYETTALDFVAALANPAVKAIVFDIDSPGGEVHGMENLARLVAEARGTKPIVSYVEGLGCSAAYWLAAATDEILATETAIVGSIGTVLSAVDTSERDAMEGIRRIEVVSSQSPKKRLDPTTDEGLAETQAMVDALAEVFIAHIAAFRGIDRETVLADYGQGWVFVGADAVSAGLVDGLMSAEELHAALVEQVTPTMLPALSTTRRATAANQEHDMAKTTRTSRPAASARAQARPARGKPPIPATRKAHGGAPAAAAPARTRRVTAAAPADEGEEDEEDDEDKEGEELDAEGDAGASGAEGGEGAEDLGDDADGGEGDEEDEVDPEEQPVEGSITLRRFRAKHPRATRAIAAAAVSRERDRIAGIQSLATSPNARGQRTLIAQAIAEGWTRAETAEALLDAQATAGAKHLEAERAAEHTRPAVPPRTNGNAAGDQRPKSKDQRDAEDLIAAARKANPSAVFPAPSSTTNRSR